MHSYLFPENQDNPRDKKLLSKIWFEIKNFPDSVITLFGALLVSTLLFIGSLFRP